ncbi:heparinase II/III domain-containing protein [Allopontixanthobacter sediminis]|uniref:Alginate lyase n=1 Tax=Allopontixanthobacter sediminis TaxID=1689985 RepID=A0A845B314_9SPHN|nr:heparinase II/III family protein [Allopontixanthobacter sediminis]MXP43992.1 alginate lyase [Allopontixanthobacter sediminis]
MIRPALLTLSLALGTAQPAQAAAEPAPATVSVAQPAPLFEEEIARSAAFLDQMMAQGVVVPVPTDPGGGYTHEQHKRNYRAIYLGGQLFKLTGEQKYADYVRDMLLSYAKLYPTLGDHPAKANQNSGRLFWQVLNDAVWLVNSVQGYEAIRGTLVAAQRKQIDDQVFRRAARFLSVDSANTFRRIHNHATWAAAGVGMTGYVLGDKNLVNIALNGLEKDGKTGFLRQTELLFSPDGYYTEGPYYQRYALMPFMVFADSIERNDPSRKIFEHRDGILLKALLTTVQLTYNGHFLPFNDALKDKSLRTEELYQGVAIAYAKTRDPSLLSVAEWQGRTVPTDAGLLLARDLAAGKAIPFDFTSKLLGDGPNGNLGAVALLRTGSGFTGQTLVTKNSSQGMGHGHFDKLSWQYYDNGREIVTDYGAARFLNIEAKQGGRYLPENESWAKQTVAHNTLVVDEMSDFGGDAKLADTLAPQQLYYSATPGEQVSSAIMRGAFEGVTFTRTMALLDVDGLSQPLVVDVMRVNSDTPHTYDLPLHYMGQIMRVGFDLTSNVTTRPVLGSANGYQHIWVDAKGAPTDSATAHLTWLLGDRFYTARWVPQAGSETILAESGANDPEFNLRREPMVIQRVNSSGSTVFASVLEAHGRYDGAAEQTTASDSQIKTIRIEQIDGSDVLVVETISGSRTAFAISYDADPATRHSAKIDGTALNWTGFAKKIDIPGRGSSHE